MDIRFLTVAGVHQSLSQAEWDAIVREAYEKWLGLYQEADCWFFPEKRRTMLLARLEYQDAALCRIFIHAPRLPDNSEGVSPA